MTDPDWHSSDPQNWETYWEAWYHIKGAKPIQVENYCSKEREALDKAELALKEALIKVVDLGLQVEAECWTVKRRHRRQVQTFPKTNTKVYVTAFWSGRLQQVLKSLVTKETV